MSTNKNKIDKTEYFENHIPHRYNLLITFKERFAELSDDKREKVRDLFRCSKDIAILMCRFFFDEFGIKLEMGKSDLKTSEKYKERRKILNIKSIGLNEIKKNNELEKHIIIVLTAANRAVAHIDIDDVNHKITNTSEEKSLIDCIDYLKQKISENMYNHSGNNFLEIMSLPNNNMNREVFNLENKL